MERRQWIKKVGETTAVAGVSAVGLGSLSQYLGQNPSPHLPVSEPSVLRPPGALTDEESFLSACIRCERCRDACPSDAIKLAQTGDPAQPGTPYILPAERACVLCLACTEACPSGALNPVKDKTDVRMGTAVVNELTCVSFNRTGACGACHTVCPLRNKALTQGMLNAPTVHEDVCVGCGLCEQACILKGVKAIRVFSGRASS